VTRPRVAVFTEQFLPYSQTFVHDELRGHQRYEAHAFCTRRRHADRFPYPDVHVGGALYAVSRISPAFDRLLDAGGYVLAHAHFGTGGVYAVPFARRHGLPLIVTFHGFDVPLLASAERFYPKYWPYAALGTGVLRQMALGLCASKELYEILREIGVPADKLRVHRIGIDLGRFAPLARDPAAEPLVVMIGRFVPKKGLVYGIRAFARVRRRLGRGRLVVAGDGELRQALQAAVREEGIEAEVSLPGNLPHGEVAALLAQADVLLAPSVTTVDGDRESGNLAVKEASATGVVPVGTWHGGLPEIIEDGATGFLVPERDPEALASRLETLLLEPDLRRRMGEAARRKMQTEYDNQARVAALEEVYDQVARKR
jgi:glycosyltransferase involved in cell wall biosynthesis